ncbi:MAG: serine protease [bacterium]|nr:serine protease [bacterium]
MFVNAIKIASKAMFPIFRVEQVTSSQMIVNVAGTGFFISSNGNFISVAHVFDNTTNNPKYFYFGKLPTDLQSPPIEIEEIIRDDSNDIYIGRVKKKTDTFFRLSSKLVDIGRTICIGGYPLAQITNNSQGGLELMGVRRYFQPSFILDYIKANSDNGAGKIRLHDGFIVRDIGLFGMSGGPVFDTTGTLVGIQGSVMPPRQSTGANGRTISVENAVVIRSNLVLDFIKHRGIRIN